MTDCWAITIGAIDDLEGARTPQAVWAAHERCRDRAWASSTRSCCARAKAKRASRRIHGTLQTEVAESSGAAPASQATRALAKHILTARFPIRRSTTLPQRPVDARRNAKRSKRRRKNSASAQAHCSRSSTKASPSARCFSPAANR